MLHWFWFENDGRYYFESFCGHDWSYDPAENIFVEDWLGLNGECRSETHEKLPPMFRPAFEELKEQILSRIYP